MVMMFAILSLLQQTRVIWMRLLLVGLPDFSIVLS